MPRLLEVLIIAGLAVVLASPEAAAAPSAERGDYLVNSIMGCGNCHTPMGPDGLDMSMNLAGRLVEQNEAFTAIAPNITPAGRVHDWSDAELAKAIREGIRPDGSLIGPPMPFEVYRGISDDDLASIIMYLRTLTPVENDPGTSTYNIPLPPAWGPPVEHVAAVPAGVTVEYGEYLAGPLGHCIVCHTPMGEQGPDFENSLGAGGMEFAGPNGTVVAPNLTPTGLAGYTDEEIATIITQGRRPDGSMLSPPMPWYFYANMQDEDVQAIILYLRSLPPKG